MDTAKKTAKKPLAQRIAEEPKEKVVYVPRSPVHTTAQTRVFRIEDVAQVVRIGVEEEVPESFAKLIRQTMEREKKYAAIMPKKGAPQKQIQGSV
jgi:hypothetical protein